MCDNIPVLCFDDFFYKTCVFKPDFFSREIASSIKMLLDAFNKVIEELPFGDSGSKQV
jgi:hypothetical protein